MGQSLNITNEFTLKHAHENLDKLFKEHGIVKVEIISGRKRSSAQNNALHMWCEKLAKELNSRGLDQRKMLKEGVDIPWDKKAVKERLWRPIQKAVTGDDSTTDPEPKEYPEIFDVLNRHLGEKHGVYVAWPSRSEG